MPNRFFLAPAYGSAAAACYGVSWYVLSRAFTDRTLTAMLFIAVAGALSAAGTLVAARLLERQPWTARFSAALLMLSAGTAVLASLFLALYSTFMFHDIPKLPLKASLYFFGVNITYAIHSFLSIAGFLLLPFIPFIAAFAWGIAMQPSPEGQKPP